MPNKYTEAVAQTVDDPLSLTPTEARGLFGDNVNYSTLKRRSFLFHNDRRLLAELGLLPSPTGHLYRWSIN